MFMGFFYVNVNFKEMCLCVSFIAQNKNQTFQNFTWFKALLLRQSSYALAFFWMVDCAPKSAAFSFPKFNAGGRGISSEGCCCSYVSPVHCMNLKQQLNFSMWAHACWKQWDLLNLAAIAQPDEEPVAKGTMPELKNLLRTSFLILPNLGGEKKSHFIASLGNLQSHPEVEI